MYVYHSVYGIVNVCKSLWYSFKVPNNIFLFLMFCALVLNYLEA